MEIVTTHLGLLASITAILKIRRTTQENGLKSRILIPRGLQKSAKSFMDHWSNWLV